MRYRAMAALFITAILMHGTAGAVDIITAFAGTGTPGDSGDGGPALAANFLEPKGLAFDAAGNLYIADQTANRIRRVSAAGIVTAIAGDGTAGFSGDGGPASAARLNGPRGIAFDASGNLYICDRDNFRIRRIDAAGIITTVAGDGSQGFPGDGPALLVPVNNPDTIAVAPSGEILFNDSSRIRKIDLLGNIVTIAGSDNQGFAGDGGPAINAEFFGPHIAVDASGNIIICDVDNNRIRRIDASTGIVNTIAGTGTPGFSGDGGPALNAQLGFPGDGIAVDRLGNIYFGDYGASEREPRVRRIDPNGIITTIAGTGAGGSTGDGGPATNAKIYGIATLALDAAGDIYYAEALDEEVGTEDIIVFSRIRKISFNNPDFVQNPDNGVTVQVASRNAGLVELAINVESLNRATFDVSTFFDDIPTRAQTVTGVRPTHQFTQSGIFIATTSATDTGTGAPAGKMRKTLAVSRGETGESPLFAAPPQSTDIGGFSMKGKFVFSGAATDSVTFSGEIELPSGMDIAAQQISVSAGNITDTVNVDAKGKAALPSVQSRISKWKIKYPKPSVGTLTGAGQKAKLSFTLSLAGMSALGFDTEGISPDARIKAPAAKSYPRAIQVALLVGGVSYEIKAPVAFKLSKNDSAGAIQGRAGR